MTSVPRLLLVAVAALVGLAGCGSGVPDIDLPTVPTTVPGGTTTIPPDYSGVALPAVPGTPTTTIPSIGPGRARIEGTVNGPDGPVPGAVVRVERFVDDFFTHADVVTRPDGTFTADGIAGGRYRVRAWRVPDLVVDKPVVFFLEDGKAQPVNFTLSRRDGYVVRASIAPSPPFEDEPANLAIAVSTRVVDPNGIVRSGPAPNVPVDLVLPADWFTSSNDPTVTDAAGRAAWQVLCSRSGTSGVAVVIGDRTFDLGVPACAAEPPPTTRPPSSTTTTTPPDGRTATTSTTRQRGGGGGGGGRD